MCGRILKLDVECHLFCLSLLLIPGLFFFRYLFYLQCCISFNEKLEYSLLLDSISVFIMDIHDLIKVAYSLQSLVTLQ